jgi:NitT/TauT family transport system substrate-binding protein
MKHQFITLLFVITLGLTSCANQVNAPAVTATIDPQPVQMVSITLPVGYVPDVQFTPLYVAIEKGYYRNAGLDVSLDYSMENDNTVLVGTGNLTFAIVSGEQVLLARAQELPVVYVMAWYQQYPVAIAAKKSSGITSLADLRGKKIGLPGLYGANYIGGMALLYSAGLNSSDFTLDSIGYNQVAVLAAGQDDAVIIYTANEPVQLDKQGIDYILFKTSDAIDLVANGLITNETTLKENPELVRRMVKATLQGIQYTIDHPDEAFEISKNYVENLDSGDELVQKQVLLNSIEQYKTDHYGYSKPEAWENMQNLLLKMGLLAQSQDLNRAFSNEYLPK